MWKLGLAAVAVSLAGSAFPSDVSAGVILRGRPSVDLTSLTPALADFHASRVIAEPMRATMVADGDGSIETIENTARIVRFFGGNWETSAEKDPRRITITIDEDKALQNFPKMQEKGFYDSSLSLEYVKKHKRDFLMSMAGVCAEFVLNLFYQNTLSDNIEMTVFYKEYDDFGRASTGRIYSLVFTRAISDKIDWNNFKLSSLPRVAKSFVLDKAFAEQQKAED